MNRIRIIGTLLLAYAAMSVAVDANAQPHMPPPQWEDTTGQTAEPEVWVRRLVGKYKFDGLACGGECTGVKGTADCIAVGTGPGVQCVINVTWQDLWTIDGQPLLLSILDPSMALFGLDPGKSAINMLLVNNKGLPRYGLGFIKGNLATFKTCLYAGGDCQQAIRIEAKSDARILYMWIDGNITLSLRRMPPAEESDPAPTQAAK
jgi:hypothetical protein